LIAFAEQGGQREKALPSTSSRHDSFVNGGTNDTSTQKPAIRATAEAEARWTKVCDEVSATSLFRRTDSWIFGANIKGKANVVMFYFAGLGAYRKELREVAADGWRGFVIE
jgi:cyclohexanone monooxygenase